MERKWCLDVKVWGMHLALGPGFWKKACCKLWLDREAQLGLSLRLSWFPSLGPDRALRQDHRAIEDKCGNLGIALRDIRLGVDPGNLHGNSERPIYFQGWLCVADTTLPSKGTGHRRNRNDDSPQDAVHLNTFIQSNLWKFQGFSLDSMPQGLPEADFAVPSYKAQFQSHDTRRNLSDAQETSQWIAGVDVMTKLVSHASVGSLAFSCYSTCLFGAISCLSVDLA